MPVDSRFWPVGSKPISSQHAEHARAQLGDLVARPCRVLKEQKAVKGIATAVQQHKLEPIPIVKSRDEKVPGRVKLLSRWKTSDNGFGNGPAVVKGAGGGHLSGAQLAQITESVTKAVTTAIRGQMDALTEQLNELQSDVKQLHDISGSRKHR
jgi:hypothetical protein